MTISTNPPNVKWREAMLHEGITDRLRKTLTVSNSGVQDVAEYLRVSRNTISNYLSGRVNPSRTRLRLWAHLMNVPFDWLVTGDWPEDWTWPELSYEQVSVLLDDSGDPVRPKGFEPPTFCSVVTPAWGIESLEPVESLPRLSSPDLVALLVALVIRQAVRR